MPERSTPESAAIFRASGEANTRECPAEPLACPACAGSATAVDAVLEAEAVELPAAAADAAAGAPPLTSAPPVPPSQERISVPTGTCWPSLTFSVVTTPSSKVCSSIVALSVSMSAMTSPLLTFWPGLMCHLTMVPCSMVSERRGMVRFFGIALILKTAKQQRAKQQKTLGARTGSSEHGSDDATKLFRVREDALQPRGLEKIAAGDQAKPVPCLVQLLEGDSKALAEVRSAQCIVRFPDVRSNGGSGARELIDHSVGCGRFR